MFLWWCSHCASCAPDSKRAVCVLNLRQPETWSSWNSIDHLLEDGVFSCRPIRQPSCRILHNIPALHVHWYDLLTQFNVKRMVLEGDSARLVHLLLGAGCDNAALPPPIRESARPGRLLWGHHSPTALPCSSTLFLRASTVLARSWSRRVTLLRRDQHHLWKAMLSTAAVSPSMTKYRNWRPHLVCLSYSHYSIGMYSPNRQVLGKTIGLCVCTTKSQAGLCTPYLEHICAHDYIDHAEVLNKTWSTAPPAFLQAC